MSFVVGWCGGLSGGWAVTLETDERLEADVDPRVMPLTPRFAGACRCEQEVREIMFDPDV
jgi:hypothetical protein